MRRAMVLLPAILMSVILPAMPVGAQDAPDPGVPLTLAVQRASRVRDVRYAISLTVPDSPDEPVTGVVSIDFHLTDASRPLALDFAGPSGSIRSVRAGHDLTLQVANEHVIVPAAALRAGANVLELAFESSPLALNRSPDFMFSLFVPARARLAFPCFDQPDIKARYRLTLDVPAGWEAVANGGERARSAGPEGTRIEFAESKPLSTYLFAFAAGRFSIERAERGGRTFRMFHRETDAAKLARNREAVFDLHAAALGWMEDYTGVGYPFGKFDFVLVPSFQFGGMEHPGAIFYDAAALLLDASATQNQKLGRARLIAHETAHMWFGDLVTMKWFDDVWMKEVFANFMAAKIVNPAFPEINHDLRFLYAHYPGAYDVDRTAGTHPIRQPLDNLNEAGGLYGAIIYQKAPIVMRQLELIVSEAGLRDGLREYLRRHAYGNAAWPDLIELLDRRTPEDLQGWSRAWVEEAGRPTLTIQRRGGSRVEITQHDPAGRPGTSWSQRAKMVWAYPDRIAVRDARFGAAGSVERASEETAGDGPLYVLPTGAGLAYGEFVLDPESRTYLTAHLADVRDPLTRGAVVVTLWEEMLAGRIAPEAMFDTFVAALPRERDELTTARMLTCTSRLFWKFLGEEDRDRRAAALERVLRGGLAAAPTTSAKAAWFEALRTVARTSGTVEWLRAVWGRREAIPGLTLEEPDYITLALELAVREVAGWKQILEEQAGRIANPDRQAQFKFVMPALSADAAERDAFFEGLQDVRNRRREAWVLQAIGYLHHPLRAAASAKYLPAALHLLRDIQRTGDIFFPKRWMDATLGGHRSASAARVVHTFLEQLPKEYPVRLRRIVLSSADDLFRASRLR